MHTQLEIGSVEESDSLICARMLHNYIVNTAVSHYRFPRVK